MLRYHNLSRFRTREALGMRRVIYELLQLDTDA